MDTYINRTIKGYELRDRIGSGGFGAVYRAYQPSIGRDVAVKVILPERASDLDFVRRFEVEAQTIARLEHPHIVPLYDYWRDPEGAFLVMRWLQGNLRDSLKQGSWTPEAVARLLEQIAGALMVAHREDVIHRDIKPDNILLDEDLNAYLADFGIAKDLSARDSSITGEGAIVGSPAYITPEQIKGETVTPRSDIYSLGVVIYEALLAEHPFPDAKTPYEMISKHINVPLPLLQVRNANLPAALNEVLQTATAKNPAQRYATVGRFAVAFRAALPNTQRTAPQPLATPLTERELDVLKQMIDGLSNKEISLKLHLSGSTVRWYVQQIYVKLDVHSRAQAIERAQKLGLITSNSAILKTDGLLIDLRTRPTDPLNSLVSVASGVPNDDLQYLTTDRLVNPYKGLRAFQEADTHDFFGRATLTEQLLARMADDKAGHFLAIIGASGSGKSSLVRAGLIPALRRGGLPNSNRWLITEMLPGTHPFEELEAALLRIATTSAPDLLNKLSEDRRGLVRAAKQVLPADQEIELVLLIDQFEELFTLTEDESMRMHFIDNLLSAATDPRSRVRIILTLRADFYDRPLNYPRLGELMRTRSEVVLPLDETELERAIVGPAERVGLSLEPGLTAALIRDTAEQPGMLPLLQYTLTELFERRDLTRLTLDAYKAIGGIAGSLARRADELYNEFDEAGQAITRQLFLRLITLGEGVEDTRRRVVQTEFAGTLSEEESGTRGLDDVVSVFAQYRLLTLDRDPISRAPTIEVAHEALIRNWSRLREWLIDSREELRIQRRLLAAVAEWNSAKQDTSFLASGVRLTQFEALAASGKIALNTDEKRYLDASVLERERQLKTEQAQQARELELAQQAAENARSAVTAQRRAANRLRYLVGVLVIFLVVAAMLSTLALGSRNDALGQKQAAVDAAATSVANFQRADQARLASAANVLIPGTNNNAELAALLAIQSLKRGYSTDGDLALQGATSLIYTKQVWHDRAVDVHYVPDGKALLINLGDALELRDISADKLLRRFQVPGLMFMKSLVMPNGRQVAGLSIDNQLCLWDSSTGALLERHALGDVQQAQVNIGVLRTSADGTRLLVGKIYAIVPNLVLWDVVNQKPIQQWNTQSTNSAQDDYLQVADLSRDGNTMALAWTSSGVQFWHVGGAAPFRSVKPPINSNMGDIALSPDGHLVALAAATSSVIWDTATGQLLRVLNGYSGAVNTIVFSADSKYLLTAGADNTARIWDAITGSELRRLTGHRDGIQQALFRPDGLEVATVGADSDIRFWDADFQHTPGQIAQFPIALSNLALSADGTRLITGDAYSQSAFLEMPSGRVLQQYADGDSFSQFSNVGTFAVAHLNTTDPTTKIRIMDARTGAELKSFDIPVPAEAANDVYVELALSPDGKLVAPSGLSQHQVDIYSTETGQRIQTIKGIGNWPVKARFSPDGTTLLVGEWLNAVKLWSVVSGQMLDDYHIAANVFLVKFSPDGRHIWVGTSGDAKEFSLNGGEPVMGLRNSTGTIFAIAASPDGKYILTTSFNDTMKIWDAATGQQLREFTLAFSRETFGLFSSDGSRIYTAGFDGTVRQWNASFQTSITDSCQQIFRDFQPTERKLYALGDSDPTCPNLAQVQPIVWRPVIGSWFTAEVPYTFVGDYNVNHGLPVFEDNTSSIFFIDKPFVGTPDELLVSLKMQQEWNQPTTANTTAVYNGVTWHLYKVGADHALAATQVNGATWYVYMTTTARGTLDTVYDTYFVPLLDRIRLAIPPASATTAVTAAPTISATGAP